MNKEQDHIDALIARYLDGEASASEIALLEEWRSRSADNQRHFRHFKLIFENAATAFPDEEFNTDAAWERVRKKLPKQGKTVSFYPSVSQRMVLRFAAALALFITVGVFVYRFANTADPEAVRLASGQIMLSDTLPDGSDVFLNRQTTIEYTYHSEKNTVKADLVGEAYFDINHDEEKVFIVEAEGTLIKDIGTAFNVRAYPDSSTIEVFVEEGEVIFYTEENPGISLKANARGVYHKDTRKFTIADPKPNITSYKSKAFVFSNQSLAAVAEKLNDVYNTRIEVGENLKDCRITVSFNEESVEEIAEIITETLGLSLSRSGNTITLKGEGCGEAERQ